MVHIDLHYIQTDLILIKAARSEYGRKFTTEGTTYSDSSVSTLPVSYVLIKDSILHDRIPNWATKSPLFLAYRSLIFSFPIQGKILSKTCFM